MKTPIKIVAIALVASFATSAMATPASAFFFGPPKFFFFPKWHHFPKHPHVKAPKAAPTSSHSGGTSNAAPYVLGCIAGSALGLISASVIKGGGLKWVSQKEWEDLRVKIPNPLTTQESQTIGFTCGLGFFPVVANFQRPI